MNNAILYNARMSNINSAKQLYRLSQWSDSYFTINELGHVCVSVPGRAELDLHALVCELSEQGLRLPILIRFADILRDRVQKMIDSFAVAIQEKNYNGSYHCVYPIKSNQQRYVVETLLSQGVGLEAGSKSELLAIIALVANYPGTIIICNGYKDSEYIRLALIAQALGHKVFIIIEQAFELDLILKHAKQMAIIPQLGMRVRIAAVAKGKWQNTGGEKSKFGLTASQVQNCINQLKAEGCLQNLQVLHCHLGSQIANLRDFELGLNECAQYFLQLNQSGAALSYIDVGGGLGVDYDGSHSRSDFSINYTLEDYAKKVIGILKNICDKHDCKHPAIITESGRALTAHHAMLVTDIIDSESPVSTGDKPRVNKISIDKALKVYQNLQHDLEKAYHEFSHGCASIADRAFAEKKYVLALAEVREQLNSDSKSHQEIIDKINEKLATKLFCNFSVFQSMPDVWGLDQVFPILPLSHLDQEPSMHAVIQDLTCDSDGRIDRYIDNGSIGKTLSLAQYDPQNPYFLGFFMLGAYQEILGDMHNLFGDTDAVHVEFTNDGGYQIISHDAGDTTSDLLQYVNFDDKELVQLYQQQMTSSTLSAELKKQYYEELVNGLRGYTYLEER